MSSAPATVIAEDGYRLMYRVWRPAQKPRATLVLFNGVMSHAGWFEPIAGPLVEAGYLVVGADRRGTGHNDRARGDALSAAMLVDDARRIIAAQREAPQPLFLVGWCWGAALAIGVALEIEAELAGLMLLAPGLYPTNELKERGKKLEAKAKPGPVDEATIESPITAELMSDDPKIQRQIEADDRRLLRYSPRFKDAMVKLSFGAASKLPRIQLPTLLVLAERDKATDNGATLRGFGKLALGQLTTVQFDSAHAIQFDRPLELARALIAFARENGG